MADWESLGKLISKLEGKETEWNSFINSLKDDQSALILEDEVICIYLDEWLKDERNYNRRLPEKSFMMSFAE